MRRLRRLVALSRDERAALLRAVPLLLLMRLAIAVLPFRAVPRLARALVALPPRPRRPLPPEPVLWAVQAAGHRFFRRNPCLTEAFTALVLLWRAGRAARLRIGVSRNPSTPTLMAHAWLESEGRIVIGGTRSPGRYAPLFSLEARP